MGQGYLIDSNAIIDYTAARLQKKGSDFLEEIFNTRFFISVIVRIEVLGFNDLPDKILAMEEFVNTAFLFPLDEAVTKETILLRRQHRKLKLGDAIIAATALIHDLDLVSRNTSDFKNIKGLRVIDPHNL
jgi:predicted nucleic acid-binding protein